MKSYIFITSEGFTFQPQSDSCEPDIVNCQVIGFGKGNNSKESFENPLSSQEYLFETIFDEIVGLELKKELREYFYLADYKNRKELQIKCTD